MPSFQGSPQPAVYSWCCEECHLIGARGKVSYMTVISINSLSVGNHQYFDNATSTFIVCMVSLFSYYFVIYIKYITKYLEK